MIAMPAAAHAPTPIAAAVDRALNAYLGRLDDPESSLAGLAGRVLIVDLIDLGWRFQIIFSIDRVHVRGRGDLPPDASLAGTSVAFGAAVAQRFRGLPEGITVSGDDELVQRFTRLLSEADIDWEDMLARRIGGIPAHQIGNLARGLSSWAQQLIRTLEADIGEYLKEEARYLPSRAEVDDFLAAVDQVRTDCDRLEARLNRLKNERGQA